MTKYDTPWKEVVIRFLRWFLAFLYPDIHDEIDWSQGCEILDKELQQIVRQGELGRSIAVGAKLDGDAALALMPEVRQIKDGAQLEQLLDSTKTAASVDELRTLVAQLRPPDEDSTAE